MRVDPPVLRDLAARVLAAAPRCGATRLVCIDGPSGAGKTTLARDLAAALGDAPVVAMDEIHPGWDGLAASVPLLHDQVVAPLEQGRPARYRRWDWVRDAWGEERDLGTPGLLVLEGAGCGSRAIAAAAVLTIWMDAPAEPRYARAIARDGETYRPHWERWAAQERALFAAEGTRERADVIIAT